MVLVTGWLLLIIGVLIVVDYNVVMIADGCIMVQYDLFW